MTSNDLKKLPNELLSQVLAKLGISHGPSADVHGLRTVYHAWCRKVPFDNILHRIHLAKNPGSILESDPAEFFENWLAYGTGGLCWSSVPALYSLLSSLGFKVSFTLPTYIMVGIAGPSPHGALLVECEGVPYLVDTAFLHSEPLPLDNREKDKVVEAGWGLRVFHKDNLWYLRGQSLFFREATFEIGIGLDQVVTFEEFRNVGNDLLSKSSIFDFSLYARVFQQNELMQISTVAFQRLLITDKAGEVIERELVGDERFELLVNSFGFAEEILRQLPSDRRPAPAGAPKKAQLVKGA